MSPSRKVVHLTSAHPPTDTRIWTKECGSAGAAGWRVVLVACAEQDREDAHGVSLHAVPPLAGRATRMTVGAWRVYRQAVRERADLYHFHDPELLPWAVLLRWQGHRVIYDVHEDVAGTVAYKTYLAPFLRPVVAGVVERIERSLARWCTAIVAATPHLETLVQRFGPPVVVVQNFPSLADAQEGAAPAAYLDRQPLIGYVGVISRARGIQQMIDAIEEVLDPGAQLHVAGRWLPPQLRTEMAARPGWARVTDHGLLDRREVARLLGQCRIGVVTLWPERNYLMSYATKMFEYMAAGIPVVASDFPLWRRIVEDAGCGVLVDPLDPGAIRGAIDWLLAHPVEAAAMGDRGRAAVRDRYNWDHEARKLLKLYEDVCRPDIRR